MDSRESIVQAITWVVNALQLIILADALLTWFPQVNSRHPLVVALRRITAPIYAPIRRLIPPQKTGFVDISPALAILALYLIGMILQSIILSG